MQTNRHKRGGALLTVLWLTAALSAIAFTVAATVRAETERTETNVANLRGYFLARGGIDRTLIWMQQSLGGGAAGGAGYFDGRTGVRWQFPGGETWVEIVPEAAKLNINNAPPEMIARLLAAMGVAPDRASIITRGILDWRTGIAPGANSPFDQFYLRRPSSFRARHASFQEIEELLSVAGVTTEIFHGGYTRTAAGELVPLAGLKDCVSVYGQVDQFSVAGASPALLAAVGVPPQGIAAIVELRRTGAILPQQLRVLAPILGPAATRLKTGGGTMFTLRAHAKARAGDGGLTDAVRSVAALIKFGPRFSEQPYHILRWDDDAAGEYLPREFQR